MAELEIHEKRVYEKNISTVLTEEIHFSGELFFSKDLMIKGEFYGAIKASGNLYIEESAYVEAEITAGAVYIKGQVKGNIMADTRVELHGTAKVAGDITAPQIVMDTGCRFDGTSRMQRRAKL
ncbi:MAG: polymer-forming cytoskeletal protein [Spirochaetales bacterium]|nr:polymer-forming cytoskeletal protein [Spirochaetales bacterium]